MPAAAAKCLITMSKHEYKQLHACYMFDGDKQQPVYGGIVKTMARRGRLTFLHCADITVGPGAALSTIKGLIQTGLCYPPSNG